jgi:hypothetical protein
VNYTEGVNSGGSTLKVALHSDCKAERAAESKKKGKSHYSQDNKHQVDLIECCYAK